MPDEDELRQRLHDDEPVGAIDLDAVLSRSRARRRPRVAAAALVSSLAVLGIVVPVSISLASPQAGTLSAGSAASSPEYGVAPDTAEGGATAPHVIKRAPADKINLCTGTLASVAPADDGLVLTVQPVDAAAGARDIPVTVTLTNTGTTRVTGSISPFPALTLSRDGIVLWHSNGPVPSLAQEIDLAPGAGATLQGTFQPVSCGVQDDSQDSFRSDLPSLEPGQYQLSAALDFSPAETGAAGHDAAVLVSGPTSPVTLH